MYYIPNHLIIFSAFPKSPFERELQRLLNESSKNKMYQPNPTNNLDQSSNKTNNNNNNGTGSFSSKIPRHTSSLTKMNGNGNNNNNNIKVKDCDEVNGMDTNSLKQHPVGLEAIKEMTRNKNPSETHL